MSETPKYYIRKKDIETGPFTKSDLINKAKNGELLPDDYIFKNGMAKWVKAKRAKGLFEQANQDFLSEWQQEVETQFSQPDDRQQSVSEKTPAPKKSYTTLKFLIGCFFVFIVITLPQVDKQRKLNKKADDNNNKSENGRVIDPQNPGVYYTNSTDIQKTLDEWLEKGFLVIKINRFECAHKSESSPSLPFTSWYLAYDQNRRLFGIAEPVNFYVFDKNPKLSGPSKNSAFRVIENNIKEKTVLFNFGNESVFKIKMIYSGEIHSDSSISFRHAKIVESEYKTKHVLDTNKMYSKENHLLSILNIKGSSDYGWNCAHEFSRNDQIGVEKFEDHFDEKLYNSINKGKVEILNENGNGNRDFVKRFLKQAQENKQKIAAANKKPINKPVAKDMKVEQKDQEKQLPEDQKNLNEEANLKQNLAQAKKEENEKAKIVEQEKIRFNEYKSHCLTYCRSEEEKAAVIKILEQNGDLSFGDRLTNLTEKEKSLVKLVQTRRALDTSIFERLSFGELIDRRSNIINDTKEAEAKLEALQRSGLPANKTAPIRTTIRKNLREIEALNSEIEFRSKK